MKKEIEYVRERGTTLDEQTVRDLKAIKDIEVILPPDEIENIILPAICALYDGVKLAAKNSFRLSREDSHRFTIAVFAECTVKDVFVYGCGLDFLIHGTQVFNKSSKLDGGGSIALHDVLTFENLKFIDSVIVTARLPVGLRWNRLTAFDREILEYRYQRGMDCRAISKEHENYKFGEILDSNSTILNYFAYPYLKSVEQEEREKQASGGGC